MPIEMCSVLVVTLSVLCQLHANHQKLVQQATLVNAIFDAVTAAMSKPNTSHCMSPSHLLCVFFFLLRGPPNHLSPAGIIVASHFGEE